MEQKFDYIIIGAGSAGCVLANRLSENGKNSVVILEAGGKDDDSNIKIPAAFPKLYKKDVDYAFYTTPQSNMKDRTMFLPRGKVLGGSSSINAMIYIRGNRHDYNEWFAMGNKGWSYMEVLPYFKKAENQQVIKSEYHGTDGPLYVTNRNYTNELSKVFVKAGMELGYKNNQDFNGQEQEGFGLYQVTNKNGSRFSAADAYLHPASKRTNLTIETNAKVTRILIEKESAVGVEFQQNGLTHKYVANKEIILCAGAYHSPQILQLSGIGDGKDLKNLGIPVIKNLKGVGKNLQDHLVYFAMFHSSYRKSLDAAERFPNIIKNLFQYLIFKQGPFNSNIGESGGFVQSSNDQPAVDTQFHFGPAYFEEHGFKGPKTGNGYSIGGKVLNPSSNGTVKLSSARHDVAPAIDHNYLATEDDMRRSIWGYKLAYKLGMTDAFAPYRKGVYLPNPLPKDDAEIEDFIRSTGETLYHPTSTCKMGIDEMAVVDPELRVYGIKNLRIADASVMPNVTRGNTHAPTMMIAEKAADMILQINTD